MGRRNPKVLAFPDMPEAQPESDEVREGRVLDSTRGRVVEGCNDPRDMRAPDWVPSREETRWAQQRASEWTALMRVRFPGKWVGDTSSSFEREVESDNLVREFRGMSNG